MDKHLDKTTKTIHWTLKKQSYQTISKESWPLVGAFVEHVLCVKLFSNVYYCDNMCFDCLVLSSNSGVSIVGSYI